jgi:hypothetical protein
LGVWNDGALVIQHLPVHGRVLPKRRLAGDAELGIHPIRSPITVADIVEYIRSNSRLALASTQAAHQRPTRHPPSCGQYPNIAI